MYDQPQLFVGEVLAGNPRTHAAYNAALRDFARFGNDRKSPHAIYHIESGRSEVRVPLDLDLVADYLRDLGARGVALETVRRRLGALAALHKQERLPDPRTDRKVKLALDELRKVGLRAAQRSLALSREGLDDVITTLDRTYEGWVNPNSRQTAQYLRDRALLLLEFEGALTRGEISSLLLENAKFDGAQLNLTVNPSGLLKDAATKKILGWVSPKRVRTVTLFTAADPTRCALVAVRRWLGFAKIVDGPVFRAIFMHSIGAEQLSPRAIADVHRYWFERANLAGVETSGLTSHSVRSGLVATLSHAGAQPGEIQRRTGLKSLDSMAAVVATSRSLSRGHQPLPKAL